MNGKERRLRRILNSDTGRSLVIAVDHGMALGAMTGIVDVGKTIRDLDGTGRGSTPMPSILREIPA